MIAYISEIFSSLQGEGPYTGDATTFVRFAGCSVACRWCDTKAPLESEFYRIETPPRSKSFINFSNPITVEKLNEHLAFFSDPTISITGGEPLEQADFIKVWLGTARPNKKILLETNGTKPNELAKIGKLVDIISMDIKLPSSTGTIPFWNEHRAFLSKALEFGKDTYVKIVITNDTTNKDIQEAIKVVTSVNKFIRVVLQPVSNIDKCHAASSTEHIESIARLCNLWLPNVSIMRQMHKEMDIL